MLLAIRKTIFATQILDRLLSVSHHVQRIHQARMFKSPPHEEHIVFIIFYQQKYALCIHVAPLSSIQKRLPFGSFASIPTNPPILSTALRTMASPIPVPS